MTAQGAGDNPGDAVPDGPADASEAAAPEAETASASGADVAAEADTAVSPAAGASAAPAEAERPPAGRGRRIAAWCVLVLATLLLILGTFAVWLNRQLLNTDNWTNTSTQLLENKQIREQIADYLVTELYANVDVAGELQAVLPKQVKPLAGPAASGLRNLATEAANSALESSLFQNLWRTANRAAHTQFVNLLEGNDVGPLSSGNGKVTLDLAAVVSKLAGDIGVPQSLIAKIPPGVGQLQIVDSKQLATAQDATSALRALVVVLWILVPLLFALAIYLARGRRRLLLAGTGFGIIIAGLLVLVARNVIGGVVVDDLAKTDAVRPAANAVWTISTSLLVQAAQGAIFVGVVVVFAAWLAGRSRPATAIRRSLAPYLRSRPDITWGVVAGLLLLLFLWGPIPATRTFWGMLLIVIVVVIGVVALRRETAREFPEATLDEDDPGVLTKIGSAAGRGGKAAAGAVGRARDATSEARASRSAAKEAQGALPPGDGDRYAELERLASLRDRGVLTDEEFAAEKASVLAKSSGA
jgi:Short C-terminal domain